MTLTHLAEELRRMRRRKRRHIKCYCRSTNSIWFQLIIVIDDIELCSLILVCATLTLIQGHRRTRKHASVTIVSQSYQSNGMEFGMVLRLVSVMTLMLLLSQ